jgi:integrase/recombinase XerD
MIDSSFPDVEKTIDDYLLWMMTTTYKKTTISQYERILNHFAGFIRTRKIKPDAVFTFDTLKAFEKDLGLCLASTAVRGLARYLYRENRLAAPILRLPKRLPDIYEQYLMDYRKTRQVGYSMLHLTRRILSALNGYLQKEKIALSDLKIGHVDDFLKMYNSHYAAKSKAHNRSCLRTFLRYLYYEKSIIRKDLASLLRAAPIFAYANPPRFLRPGELKRLFSSLNFSTPKNLRANAMLYLAYSLGLRPKEISLISLDDILFSKGEIALPDRKNTSPIKLPLPEDTLKAICAYIIGARAQTESRALFLTLRPPFRRVSPASVSQEITASLHKANIPQTAYSLRHSYAQGLLEAGRTIFEIKEMLGHDKIQTSRRYIKIHIQLMRKVLWDETF